MLRRTTLSRTNSISIAWPIDSALRPGTPLAVPTSDSGVVAAAPLTRAKARWLLHRGAADSEVATVAIQTSTTWAAACSVISSLTSDAAGSSNNEASIVTAPVLEALSVRLVQELCLPRAPALNTAVGALHKRQVVEALSASAAEEADLQPVMHQEQLANEPQQQHHVQELSQGTSDSNKRNSSDNSDGMPFAVKLALTNTGTLGGQGDAVALRVLDYATQSGAVASGALFAHLSLLPARWTTALTILSRADRTLSTGAPLPVFTSAIRTCATKKQWQRALRLFDLASLRYSSSSSVLASQPLAAGFALNALTAMQLSAAPRLQSTDEQQGESAADTERGIVDATHWAWTLRILSGAGEVARNDSFWLRGETGTALCNSAVVAAAMSSNWQLALEILTEKCDTQAGSLVNKPLVDDKKLLLVPDADSLFATVCACIVAGRHTEAAQTMKLFAASGVVHKAKRRKSKLQREQKVGNDDEATSAGSTGEGLGYNITDVSGLVADHCLRSALNSAFSRAFAVRCLAPAFIAPAVVERRKLWTLQHCIALASFSRAALITSNSNNNAASTATVWQLAASAFSEYCSLTETVAPRAAMLFGSAVIANEAATRRMIDTLIDLGVGTADDSGDGSGDGGASSSSSISSSSSLRALPLLASSFHAMMRRWESALTLAMKFFDDERELRLKKQAEQRTEHQQQKPAMTSSRTMQLRLDKSVLIASKRVIFACQQRDAHWTAALILASAVDEYDPTLRQRFRSLSEATLHASILTQREFSLRPDPLHVWRIALSLYSSCRDKAQTELRGPMRRLLLSTGCFAHRDEIDNLIRLARTGQLSSSSTAQNKKKQEQEAAAAAVGTKSKARVKNIIKPATSAFDRNLF